MKKLEISLGLLAGYLFAGLVNMFAFDKSWAEAFSDEKILAGLAGIALSIFIIQRTKKRKEDLQE
ncbi:MAG: hypothetical protein KDD15_06140 [Lewinella sp.]|nr:hypothetical protein [Lewinella sp.]